QNRPEDIPKLLDKLGEGYDVVCGWRYRRCDHFKRKLASNMANLFRRILFREKIHDVGCSLRVYSRRSIESIKLHGELHRFITAILKKNGFKIGEVPIDHYPRLFGRSKYGIVARLLKSIPDFLSILF
ncbi:MAG: glycosyltransferase, partial [Candidatus Omnitrophica bacterium]|nr:glycosyltransferase [Candidatus Omnitrophota bacterium]